LDCLNFLSILEKKWDKHYDWKKLVNRCWLSLTTVIEPLVKGLSAKVLETIAKYAVTTKHDVGFGNGSL
jgi:hypothetical protein